MYRLLADLVLFIHFMIAVFIIFSLLLIVIGGVRKWRWIHNPWFRYLHLFGILFIVLQAWLGKLCPLTIVENSLREKAGEATYPGSFVAYWMHDLLYVDLPIWVLSLFYTGFAILVLICWIKFRPAPFKSIK